MIKIAPIGAISIRSMVQKHPEYQNVHNEICNRLVSINNKYLIVKGL